MMLLNPIALWALAGLLIPISIHLLSRKEGKTIRIGSIRFLTETSTSKFSSIRLNEVMLLTVRCLIVALLAICLAGLIFSSTSSKVKQWVLVESGLEGETQIRTVLDSLQKSGFEIRLLAEGFPVPKDDTTNQTPDYYQLSEALASQNVNAVIFARNQLSGFKGKRIALPANVRWISFADIQPTTLEFDSANENQNLKINIVYDEGFEYDKKIMLAALHSIQASESIKFDITEQSADTVNTNQSADWLIWLSTRQIYTPMKTLAFSEPTTRDLITQETKRRWLLNRRLNEEVALDNHLSVQLMNMLFKQEIDLKLAKADTRAVSDQLAWAKEIMSQERNTFESAVVSDKFLILGICLLFIVERSLAFARKQ